VDIKENFDEVIDAVKEWLSLPKNTRWLMIYNNYDNPKLAGNTDPAAVDISLNHINSHYHNTVATSQYWSSYPNQKAGGCAR
jgi:hypothetical protein